MSADEEWWLGSPTTAPSWTFDQELAPKHVRIADKWGDDEQALCGASSNRLRRQLGNVTCRECLRMLFAGDFSDVLQPSPGMMAAVVSLLITHGDLKEDVPAEF